MREFSTAELNMLSAAGSQLAASIGKSMSHKETRTAYDNLRLTQEQLLQSEKMAAIGQLISGVAHELNNPLTAILGYGQLLRSEELLSSRGAEYVEKLSKQAQRTHHIVQNLLSFARQQEPQRRPVDINQIIEDTLVLTDFDLIRNKISIVRQFDPALPPAFGDFNQLQQVFLNIINNAVDATLEGGGAREILIATFLAGKQVIIEITDSGLGVKDPRKVFDPFYTTKPVGKGTGLGLSICYGIVKEHGGEISVRNSPPRGATFSVQLPLAEVSQPNASHNGECKFDAGRRILVVESDHASLEFQREILLSRRIHVQTAPNGRDALRLLENERFDGVVMDVQVSGDITGWALFRWIETHRPELAGRIVFTFANGDDEEVRVLLANSGCISLQRPFPIAEFEIAIRKILEPGVPHGKVLDSEEASRSILS
jgi:two-component system NtrC family sensor kinase